jgi:hypothetical protein
MNPNGGLAKVELSGETGPDPCSRRFVEKFSKIVHMGDARLPPRAYATRFIVGGAKPEEPPRKKERAVPRASRPSRITVVLAGVMMALALAVAAVALAPAPADAAKKTKVVTRTFSNIQQITIFGGGINNVERASPYPSERRVRGFDRGRILDVNVSLNNFSHANPDDVDVMLSKGGMSCIVMSDVGGETAARNIYLRLDDEAANRLPDEGPLAGGRFRPTNADSGDFFYDPPPRGFPALSGFDGLNPNGTWQLRVVDDAAFDNGGQFAAGWSVTIKARVQR